MRHALLVAACALLLPQTFGHAETTWYKGVTHIHSLWSDGDGAPEIITAWYKDRDYDFIASSDHNILQEGEVWFPVEEDGRLTPGRLEEIRERFGEDWPEMRDGENGPEMRLLTHEELQERFEEPGAFVMIQGEEITTPAGGPHVNAINIRELVEAGEGHNNTELMQRYVDAVREQSERYGVPMITHLNHVNWSRGITIEEVLGVRGLDFFEVYNGHPGVHNWGNPGQGMPSTEVHWDVTQSIKLLQDPGFIYYGLATDDSHNYHEFAVGRSNPGRGWVMVKSEVLEADAIVDALKRGDFYSSTGVLLDNIERTDDALSFDIQAEDGIRYTTYFLGTRRGFDTDSSPVLDPEGNPMPRASHHYSPEIGEVLHATTDTSPRYEFEGDELYVRARVISNKMQDNPFRDGDFEMAWVQPVLVNTGE